MTPLCPVCEESKKTVMVYIGGTVGMGIPLYACKKCGVVATALVSQDE